MYSYVSFFIPDIAFTNLFSLRFKEPVITKENYFGTLIRVNATISSSLSNTNTIACEIFGHFDIIYHHIFTNDSQLSNPIPYIC